MISHFFTRPASVQTHPLLISNVLETKTESIVFEINFIKDSLT